MFSNIVTLKPGDLTLAIPFEDWGVADLRVISETPQGEVLLALGADYTLANGTLTIDPAHSDFPVTVAAVPCPEIVAPKFGRLENEDLIDVLAGLKAYLGYLDVRQAGTLRAPVCPSDDCLMPVFTDDGVLWLNSDEVADRCGPVVGGFEAQIAALTERVSDLSAALSAQVEANAARAQEFAQLLAEHTSATANNLAAQFEQVAVLLGEHRAAVDEALAEQNQTFERALNSVPNNRSQLGQVMASMAAFQ